MIFHHAVLRSTVHIFFDIFPRRPLADLSSASLRPPPVFLSPNLIACGRSLYLSLRLDFSIPDFSKLGLLLGSDHIPQRPPRLGHPNLGHSISPKGPPPSWPLQLATLVMISSLGDSRMTPFSGYTPHLPALTRTYSHVCPYPSSSPEFLITLMTSSAMI